MKVTAAMMAHWKLLLVLQRTSIMNSRGLRCCVSMRKSQDQNHDFRKLSAEFDTGLDWTAEGLDGGDFLENVAEAGVKNLAEAVKGCRQFAVYDAQVGSSS